MALFFCTAPGTMGLLGNLWAGEIQEQLIHARTQKAPVRFDGQMGMGMG